MAGTLSIIRSNLVNGLGFQVSYHQYSIAKVGAIVVLIFFDLFYYGANQSLSKLICG